jgi:hypothetical protein
MAEIRTNPPHSIIPGTPGKWLAAALTSNKKRNALQVGREMKNRAIQDATMCYNKSRLNLCQT